MTDPFDSLRGRARPAAQPATDALSGVISAGRRRRARALVGGGAGTALLAGVLVLALAGGNEAPQTLDVIDDPSPSVAVSEDPSDSPTPEPSASASASASASSHPEPSVATSAEPTGDGTAVPSASETYDDSYWTRTFNDGQPGWSGGYGGCGFSDESWVQPDIKRAIDLETVLPRKDWRPGERLQAFVVLTNNSSSRQEHDASSASTRGVLWDGSHKPVSAIYSTDAIVPTPVALDPGESMRILVDANTSVCGDGPGDPEPGLPAGDYTLTFDLGERLGRTPGVTVTLDPAASTTSVWPMQPRAVPRPVGRPCAAPAPSSPVGGFRMDVETTSDTVAAGGTLGATVVITATRADTDLRTDPRGNPAHVAGATEMVSTGVDPGPYEDPRDYQEYPQARDAMPHLEVGDSLRFPVSWVAQSCPAAGSGEGSDLAPGTYDVRFGLLVIAGGDSQRGFWFDEETVRVTVRS